MRGIDFVPINERDIIKDIVVYDKSNSKNREMVVYVESIKILILKIIPNRITNEKERGKGKKENFYQLKPKKEME